MRAILRKSPALAHERRLFKADFQKKNHESLSVICAFKLFYCMGVIYIAIKNPLIMLYFGARLYENPDRKLYIFR